MAIFRYSATDMRGVEVEGSVSATTASQAHANLIARGLTVQTIDGIQVPSIPKTNGATPVGIPSTSAPSGTGVPRQININQPRLGIKTTTGGSIASAPPIANAPANTSTYSSPIDRRGKRKLRTLMLLFSQFSSYYQSGQNPVTMLEMLSKTQPNKNYAYSLGEASKEVANGIPISKALGRFTTLYPPHVEGTLAAAEAGAFMPEACILLSDQFGEWRKIDIFWTVLYWVTVTNIVGFWPVYVLFQAIPGELKRLDAVGGQMSGYTALGQAMGSVFKGPSTIFFIAFAIGIWLFGRYWLSDANRLIRHALVLKVMFVGKRARSESIAHFTWIMSLVSKVGLAPITTFRLAANSVPNQKIRHDLIKEADAMKENTKLSEVFMNCRSLTPELAMMAQTGEMTGTLPQVLEQASKAEGIEFKSQDKFAKGELGCWMFIVGMLLTLAFAWVYVNYLENIITYYTK